MTIEETFTALDAAVLTGASDRQLHRYADLGVAGDRPGQGHGRRRTYTATDLEIVHALQGLLSLGGPVVSLARVVADAVRTRPVNPSGEWLIVTAEPHRAQRWDRFLLDEIVATDTPRLWAVPLRSFSTVASTSPVVPQPAGDVDGAAGSRPAPPQVPPPGGSTHRGGAS